MEQFTAWLGTVFGGGGAPSLGMMCLGLLLAFIGGQAVAWVYMWTHSGVSYSRAYVQSLVLIALVVSLVMMIVGANVVVAFGLLGALTVIRFRNVLKDTRDTAFIFMELAVGLAAGTWNLAAVLVGVIAFAAVMMYMHATSFGSRLNHDALLRIAIPTGAEGLIEGILGRHCQTWRLISQRSDIRAERVDYSYRLLLRDPDRGSEFVDDLNAVDGVASVSLLRQEDQSEI